MYKIALSPFHKTFYFEWLLNQNDSSYNMVSDHNLKGKLDIPKLIKSINHIISDHVLMNSHITSEDNEFYWIKNDKIFEIEIFEGNESQDKIYQFISSPFDLESGPLYRFLLINLSEDNYRFIIVFHHIFVDGVSGDYFFIELSKYYNEINYKIEASVDSQINSINNLSNKLNKEIQSNEEKANQFWSNLINKSEPLNLDFKTNQFFDHSASNDIKSKLNIHEFEFSLSDEIVSKTNKISKLYRITPYLFSKVIYSILLHKFTGQNNFCLSFPIAIKEGIEFIYGAQVNINLLPFEFSQYNNIVDIFEYVKNHIKIIKNKENKYHYFPIYKVISKNNKDLIRFSVASTYFIESSFCFENIEDIVNNSTIHYGDGLSFLFEQRSNCIKYKFIFKNENIHYDLVKHFIECYQNLYSIVLNDLLNVKESPLPLTNYNCIPLETFSKIVYEWNQTESEILSNKTISKVFENQVEKTPDQIAIVFEETKLSYLELNDKANQFAHYLIHNYEIKPDTLIGLCLERSEFMIISILAVLKAGAAYVPIDPSYPEERIKYILEDTKTQIVVTNKMFQNRIEKIIYNQNYTEINSGINDRQFMINSCNVISIDSEFTIEKFEKYPKHNLITEIRNHHLAYVIYTSGTTGNPKGVMIEHKGVVNLALEMAKDLNQFRNGEGHKFYNCLFFSNYVFDMHVWEIIISLFQGNTLHILSSEIRKDIPLLSEYINTNDINIDMLTPAILDSDIPLNIDILYVGGEKIQPRIIENLLKENCTVLTAYGPTETTIISSRYFLKNPNESSIIGKPLTNVKYYILDNLLNPLPLGAVGELHIGGIGLARGYLNNPDLTNKKYILNPFQTEKEKNENRNEKLYKTGDLVRFLPDGNIEYIGRNDFQVKIRGFRIELGEVERAMCLFPGVKQSVVLAKEYKDSLCNVTENKYLVAYFVISNDEISENIESELYLHLQSCLPEYMVPAILIPLENVPLTVNGKIDRKALPEPEFTQSKNYLAPQTESEKKLVQIWADVLALSEENVGINDDFYRLGGNSILAIKLLNIMNKKMEIKFSLPMLFKAKTIQNLLIEQKNNKQENIEIQKCIVRNEKQILSFAQDRLWFLDKFEGGGNNYNIPMVLKLASSTSPNLLKKSLEKIINRHEVLRSYIKEDVDGNSYQIVGNINNVPFLIHEKNVSSKKELEELISIEINHVFNLKMEYPFRVCFFKFQNKFVVNGCSDESIYLSMVAHHIAFDGWSIGILQNELKAIYNSLIEERENIQSKLSLPDLSIQYKDFAYWQRNYLTGDVLKKQVHYWKTKLSGYETLNLITDKPRPKEIDYTGKDIFFELDQKTLEGLKDFSKNLGVSLYSVLLSAFYLQLRSYSGQNDIVIGTPIANRHYSQIENLIGFFVNTLALRAQIDPKMEISDFIKQVGDEVMQAQLHQDLPFEKLVEELNVERDLSRHPIFQVMFNYEDSEERKEQNLLFKNLDLENVKYSPAKFDLNLTIANYNNNLKCSFNFAVSLFELKTVECFVESYKDILKGILNLINEKNGKGKIENFCYLNKDQFEEIIYRWNQRGEEFSRDKTVSMMFEEQVEKTPDQIALVFENTKLSYKELNAQSNQFARYLTSHYEVKPDTLVALCLERSELMVISILAVLKAGCAYVPMDPSYPEDRIKYILEDTKTQIVMTNSKHQKMLEEILDRKGDLDINTSLPGFNKDLNFCDVLAVDSEFIQQKVKTYPVQNLITETRSNHLAYVIYTSGTTGKPKGVMVEHNNAVRLFLCTNNQFHFTEQDVWVLFHSYVFDFSVWELWGALTFGGKLVVPGKQYTKDLESFYQLCVDQGVTVLNQTPTAFYQFADIVSKEEKADRLRFVIFGGEALNCLQLKTWWDCKGSQAKLINMYGITETTVHVTFKEILPNELIKSAIGKPISDLTSYVLDANLNPLPLGAVGELHIGGAGLARGYLNRPELTTERFILNPFQTEEEKRKKKNSRLYKTGDLVRYLPDGNLEYIGRNDFQVKIRGFRIELGEIESAIGNFPGIKQCVVLAKEHKDNSGNVTENKYLVAYYVPDNGNDTKLLESGLFTHLQSCLPEYMVPTVLVPLEYFPLTINGKLDRKALPEAERTQTENYVAPQTDSERKMVQIWAEVLGLPEEKIGIEDDFFRLGGDSIISIQISSKIRQKLQINVTVKDIFKYRNIEKIYQNVILKQEKDNVEKSHSVTLKTEQGLLTGFVPLLPIQEWFFDSKFENPNHWNQSFLIKTPNLNISQLKESVHKLTEHHDCFRLCYQENEGTYSQFYLDNHSFESQDVNVLNIQEIPYEEGNPEFLECLHQKLTAWQNNFDLKKGKTYCIGYLYGYRDQSARVFVSLHHLIVDAVSWRIIAEDLKDLYHGKSLGLKGTSYRQWVHVVEEYAIKHAEEKKYWENSLSHSQATEDLFKEDLSPDKKNSISKFELDREQTQLFLKDSSQAYHTQINDLLLSALARALFQLTGEKRQYVTLEGHGREEIDPNVDIGRTIGWFTTMYPICLEADLELSKTIINTKETLRSIPQNGIGFGALFGYGNGKRPRISFNYLGQFDKGTERSMEDQKGLWSITSEGSGDSISFANKDHNIININGMVIDGKLGFFISSQLHSEKTDLLATLFQDELISCVSHCTGLTRSYFTPSDIDHIISANVLDKIQKEKEIQSVYYANSLQQGFVFHALNQGEVDDAYFVQVLWQYHQGLNLIHLKKAWEFAQEKFGSLRLRFSWDEKIVQVIDKKGELDWRYVDLSHELDLSVQEETIKEIQKKDRQEKYHLQNGNLFRVYLIKQSEEFYTCIFSSHHAISDGWSNPILLNEIHDSYLRLQEKKTVTIIADMKYEEAQKYLQEHKDENKGYWENQVSQVSDHADFSFLLSEEAKEKNIRINEYKHILDPKEETLLLNPDVYLKLETFCQKEGVSLNAVLQYAWHKAIHIFGNCNTTVVGTTVSGRNLPIDGIENAFGLFINTLPLVVHHKEGMTICASIQEIQNSINEANSRSDINLASLQREGKRLFDSLFVFENYPLKENKDVSKQIQIEFKSSFEKLDYPLGVIAYKSQNSCVFQLRYAGELFSLEQIQNLTRLVEFVLQQVSFDPSKQEKELSYLNKDQFEEIIYRWNQRGEEFSRDKTVSMMFEEQVEKTPDQIALVFENTKLSYKELNAQSNQFARYLTSHYEVKPDTLVALCLERSELMVISILAVLKAGCAYVPMDPSYPEDRIKYILEDTKTQIVMTNSKHQKMLEEILDRKGDLDINTSLPGFNKDLNFCDVLAVDSEFIQQKVKTYPVQNLITETRSNHLAYVIYTSGTTGKPKGVMVEHNNAVRLFLCTNNQFHFTEQDVWVLFHSYVFDFSVWELWGALTFGGKLVVPGKQYTKDLESFYQLCVDQGVTVLNQTPTAFYQFADIVSKEEKADRLRFVIFGGEALNCLQLKTWWDCKGSQAKLINMYGITETTVHVTFKEILPNELIKSAIGKPISDLTSYVLDANLNPLPLGAVGELHIGGAGLARGYLNRPELTTERFILNPFQTEEEKRKKKNSRLYKTGDLVRYLPDGNLEYIGRNDFQVKIRGFRIELGEIESAIGNFPGIKQCVVLAKEHKDNSGNVTENKYLVAYYVPDNGNDTKLLESGLFTHLQSCLPEYMVPTVLVPLEYFPLTINGKLDRKALPEAERTQTENYVAPQTDSERKMVQIWAEVLGLPEEKIGIEDDFFRLGGNSISALMLISKINNSLKLNIKINDLLKNKNIKTILNNILNEWEEYDL